ncbi:conserved hypothetical protein [Coccidioides posadasii str. Silveira]|uniref:Uncharacterized protein n=1 Tax=Coccidioides posadasii (strain RMSCC 757 / Silveira) TaxID=443226 RepID=E9DBH7_COCPS|nr:conserved hypothetical protein [Coccidioides posadasii str. Silveira]
MGFLCLLPPSWSLHPTTNHEVSSEKGPTSASRHSSNNCFFVNTRLLNSDFAHPPFGVNVAPYLVAFHWLPHFRDAETECSFAARITPTPRPYALFEPAQPTVCGQVRFLNHGLQRFLSSREVIATVHPSSFFFSVGRVATQLHHPV